MAGILQTDTDTLMSHSRKNPLPLARYLLGATFCGSLMNMTTSEAGRLLGGRDHATILHGIEVVALIRQNFGTPKEKEIVHKWDNYMQEMNRKQQETTMNLNNIKMRGRIDSETWTYGNNISINADVITINGRYVDPETVGMCTGLTGADRRSTTKKREIYEGDIITRKGIKGNYLVRYDEQRAAFRLIPTIQDGPKEMRAVYMSASESYTVIGNRYDAPALGRALSETFIKLQELGHIACQGQRIQEQFNNTINRIHNPQ